MCANADSNVSTGGPHQHGENAALQMPIQIRAGLKGGFHQGGVCEFKNTLGKRFGGLYHREIICLECVCEKKQGTLVSRQAALQGILG